MISSGYPTVINHCLECVICKYICQCIPRRIHLSAVGVINHSLGIMSLKITCQFTLERNYIITFILMCHSMKILFFFFWHKLMHIGEKPYQWNHCDKAFLRKSSKKFTSLTHNGVKQCPRSQCDIFFTRNIYFPLWWRLCKFNFSCPEYNLSLIQTYLQMRRHYYGVYQLYL